MKEKINFKTSQQTNKKSAPLFLRTLSLAHSLSLSLSRQALGEGCTRSEASSLFYHTGAAE